MAACMSEGASKCGIVYMYCGDEVRLLCTYVITCQQCMHTAVLMHVLWIVAVILPALPHGAGRKHAERESTPQARKPSLALPMYVS